MSQRRRTGELCERALLLERSRCVRCVAVGGSDHFPRILHGGKAAFLVVHVLVDGALGHREPGRVAGHGGRAVHPAGTTRRGRRRLSRASHSTRVLTVDDGCLQSLVGA